jgi:hypothetical protein
MTPNKLKAWRAVVDNRLSALENLLRLRSSTPQDTEDKSPSVTPEKQTESGSKQSTKRRLATLAKWIVLLLTWSGFSLGVVTGYLALIPKVTVTETEPLNPANIFTSHFIISNDGPLGINSVDVSCDIRQAEFEGNARYKNNMITSNQLQKTTMFVGERATVVCPLNPGIFGLGNSPVKRADIDIVLQFRPDFTWWRVMRILHFVTVIDSKGNLHWVPQPLYLK